MAESQDNEKLCGLLVAAAEKLATIQGAIWSHYKSGSDIAKFILECRNAINQGEMTSSQKRELWTLFAPTCDWDDVVGEVELANEIFPFLEKLCREEIRSVDERLK